MKTQISRTAFCQKCFEAERPKTGDFYSVVGSTGVHVHKLDYAHPSFNPKGFVPHIFTLETATKGIVTLTRTCGMNECGLDIRNNPEYETKIDVPPYLVYIQEKKTILMKVSDWNALVASKDLGYRLDE
tara:strand:- start:956 stop:1342 length:387 start_codon:yes stop_codon:yes gene_type:complete